MLVYNKHLMKGVFVSVCLLRPQQTGQRIVAWNLSSNLKMLMINVVPKKCISSLWEQRVINFLSFGTMG